MRASEAGGGHVVAVVEDNDRNARLVHDVLTAHGYRVEVFVTGGDAVQQIPELGPDIVLLDIQLPDIDGLRVLQRLRAAGLHGTPAIAVTAFAMAGDRESLLDAGFDDYLAKPIDISSLADRVAAAIDAAQG